MSRRNDPPVTPGVVIVDKPSGLTSHDVVSRLRRIAGTRRVGHAGTLDPMATGVLVLGIGAATRLLTFIVGADKEYTATIRLGQGTSTDDAEGEVVSAADADGLGRAQVGAGLRALTGELRQVPSQVSAIKVDGKRAYARVRAGEDVTLAARPVTVRAFDLLDLRRVDNGGSAFLDVDVRTVVSSGTYVRALARDLGAALGVGGHLTVLRRTRVGAFGLDAALTLEQAADGLTLLAPAQAAAAVMGVRRVSVSEAADLGFGRRLPAAGLGPGPVAAIGPDGTLIAILEESGDSAKPVLVMAGAATG